MDGTDRDRGEAFNTGLHRTKLETYSRKQVCLAWHPHTRAAHHRAVRHPRSFAHIRVCSSSATHQVLFLVVVFVFIFLISIIAGAAGPFVWKASHGNGQSWDNCTQVEHASQCKACVTYFEAEVVDMQPYDQVMYLEVAMENPVRALAYVY